VTRLKFVDVQVILVAKGYQVEKISGGYISQGHKFPNLTELKAWADKLPANNVKSEDDFDEHSFDSELVGVEILQQIPTEVPVADQSLREETYSYKGFNIFVWEKLSNFGEFFYKISAINYLTGEMFHTEESCFFKQLALSWVCNWIDENTFESASKEISVSTWEKVAELSRKVKNEKN
jgi:hypothetical protein